MTTAKDQKKSDSLYEAAKTIVHDDPNYRVDRSETHYLPYVMGCPKVYVPK